MKTEDRLRSAIREYADSIRPEPSSWNEIERRMAAPLPRRWRPVAVGVLTAAAVAAIIAVRLVTEQSPAGIELATPTATPPGTVEPTPSPVSTEGWRKEVITGGWELRFPASWDLRQLGGGDPSYPSFQLSNPEFRSEANLTLEYFEAGGEAEGISFTLELGSGNAGSESIGSPDPAQPDPMCTEPAEYPEIQVLDCRTMTINGREWAYAVQQTNPGRLGTPNRLITVGTGTDKWSYVAQAHLYGTTNFESRMAMVDELIRTFVIH